MTDNLYDFAGLPYKDITVRTNEDYRNIPAIDLSSHIARTDSHRWEFDIDFIGGRDEDVIGKLMTHFVVNKNKTFKIKVPQNDALVEQTKLAVKPYFNVNDYLYHPDMMEGANKNELVFMTAANAKVIPAGVFLTLPGDNKTYITADNLKDTNKYDNFEEIVKGYPKIIRIPIYPRTRKPLPRIADARGLPVFKFQPAYATVIHSLANNNIITSDGLIQSARFTFIENLKNPLQ